MRISTNLVYQRGLESLQRSENALYKVQQQLTRQTKLLSPSDDPIANAQVMNINNSLAQNEQFMRNSVTLENGLRQSEGALNSVNDSMLRARELTAGAINGSYGPEDRQAVAKELRAIEKQLFDQANSRDAQGEYLFSGYQSRKQPMEFNTATDSYQYVGDQGQRELQLSPSLKLAANEPGNKPFAAVSQRVDLDVGAGAEQLEKLKVTDREAFVAFTEGQQDAGASADLAISFDGSGGYTIADGDGNALDTGTLSEGKLSFNGLELSFDPENLPANGDTIEIGNNSGESQNAITLIRDLASALEGKGVDGQWQDQAQWALDDLNTAMDSVVGTQADIGARINVMEATRESIRESDVVNQTARAELSDVDYNEAVTELVKNETLYQASQQVFSRINQLSLFDYVQ